MPDPITLQMIFSLIGGGLAGGFLSSRLNSTRYKTELSLKMISEMFDRVEEIENVFGILKNKSYLKEERIDSDRIRVSMEPEAFVKIMRIGDRFDQIMYLYVRHQLDRELIDSSIKKFVEVFLALLDQKDIPEEKRFCASSYEPCNGEYVELKWSEAWPNLAHFYRGSWFPVCRCKAIIFG